MTRQRRTSSLEFYDLARILFMGEEIGLLAMLAAYYDASGKTSDLGDVAVARPVLAVAGFVATVDEWQGFIHAWKQMLSSYGLPYAHMKEYAHSCGPYQGWPEENRRSYIKSCVGLIAANTSFGASTAVDLRAYERVGCGLGPISAYAFASIRTMVQLGCWQAKSAAQHGIRHIFEGGDGHDAELHLIARTIRENPELLARTRFRSLSIEWKAAETAQPLQAADFLAYETMKYVRDSRMEEGNGRKLRQSASILLQTGRIDAEFFGESGLRRYAENIRTMKQQPFGGGTEEDQ